MPPVPRRALPPLFVLPLLPRPAAALPAEYRFRVMREGSQIGTHRVAFAQAGNELAARTDVDIAVKLAGFTVFRLTHRFGETWAGDRLRSAASRLDRNGRVSEMEARAEGNAVLVVRGPEGPQRLPADAAPLTWWEPGRFNRPLFDNATGKPLRLQLARAPLPGGGTRWTATGDEEGEGTYGADGAWLGWRTKGEDGSTVTYERA
jgi:uncharacterized protein DUF6134